MNHFFCGSNPLDRFHYMGYDPVLKYLIQSRYIAQRNLFFIFLHIYVQSGIFRKYYSNDSGRYDTKTEETEQSL